MKEVEGVIEEDIEEVTLVGAIENGNKSAPKIKIFFKLPSLRKKKCLF